MHAPAGRPKSILLSRTLWLNVSAGLIAAAMAVLPYSSSLPPRAVLAAAGLLAAGNFLLRLLTDRPVSFSGPKRPR